MSVLKRGVCVCVHDVQVRKTERLVACVCVYKMGRGACVYETESDMCVCVGEM